MSRYDHKIETSLEQTASECQIMISFTKEKIVKVHNEKEEQK